MKIRDTLPSRRPVTTNNPTGEKWSEHKPDLKEDFHSHCGYCGSFDGFRHTYYEVDHFVPKDLFREVGWISDCQYDNLVYSCKFCNNKKWNKWPSRDINIHNKNNEWFVDPCNSDYDDHLFRTQDWRIRWKTDLWKWMVEKGFKFDERDYAIQLFWNLNEIRKLLNILKIEKDKHEISSDLYNKINDKMKDPALLYYELDMEVQKYYDTL